MPHCDNCGAYTHLPFSCNYCGGNYCGKCRLPPNHRCVNLDSWKRKPRPYYPTRGWGKSERYEERKTRNKNYVNIRNLLNLKNLTILSIILIAVGIFSQQYLISQFAEIFKEIIIIGVLGLIISYFIYAVKCWDANSQISAVLMITIPLLAYFFSTTKIPESTNIVLYIPIQFCFYAIISVILLYVCNKIKLGIYRYIFKNQRRSHWYFHPNPSYIIIAIVSFSIIAIVSGTPGIWSNNVNVITNSVSTSSGNSQYIQPSQYPTSTPPSYTSQITIIPTYSIRYTSMEDSKKYIDYVNTLRRNAGVNALQFDSRVYNIAMTRVNDMDKYGYLDHTNPSTGTCAYSLKSQFGLTPIEYVAENAFGFSSSSGENYYSGIEKDAINAWMSDRGHKYNMLYPHIAGAVACSNGGHCVFIGLNHDQFTDRCYTAAQGEAFWATSGKQPYEK